MKPGANRVTWVHGDVNALPALQVDLTTMTRNVAQVFVDDDEWSATLKACRRALRPDGYMAFESRVPENQARLRWTREASHGRAVLADVGPVESWVGVTEVRAGTVSFRTTYVFAADDATYTPDSTLRFRSYDELELLEGGWLRSRRGQRCAGPTGPRVRVPYPTSHLTVARLFE